MDAIAWLIIGLASAWLAYTFVAAERRGRGMVGMGLLGAYLAVFGAMFLGLGTLWSTFLREKLTDDFPSENTMLFVGLVIIAGLVVCALDLLGVIDIMGKMRESINRTDVGRPTPGNPSGPGGPGGDD